MTDGQPPRTGLMEFPTDNTATTPRDICEDARALSAMLAMGERISFGRDAAMIDALVAEIERLRASLNEIDYGYGPNHLSKFARDTARKALGKPPVCRG